MKKVTLILAVVFVLFSFSGCNNYQTAKSFQEEAIENGFNNLLVGGNLAYCDNALYYYSNLYPNAGVMNAYEFTDKGKTKMLSDKKIPTIYFKGFYGFNNKLYSCLEDNDFLSVYDSKNRKFVKSDTDIKIKSYAYYLSDDLIISYKNSKTLKVNYKEKTCAVTLESGIDNFYPVGEIIYLQNDRGALYSFNLKTPEKEPKFIDELANDGSYKVFSVCGDYVYYDYYREDGEVTNGLYRFSLNNKTHQLVTDKEVSCVNSWNNKFYFVADGNLYLDKLKASPIKISDLKTQSIYIFDNKWIYLDDLEGNVFRINHNGTVIEKIDILTIGQMK